MSRIDVIVPVYNVEKYLRRCLDSIRNQTFEDWRAICVDDGSTDSSPAILEEYSSSDARFMVIHQKNGGLSDARNTGMDHAEAEFIVFVDSDDLIHPQTFEIALSLADRDGSDIVSWYRDRRYRHQVKLARFLKRDPVDVTPCTFSKRFSMKGIKSFLTEDLVGHCTEMTHSDIDWPVKHFYVWRHLIRREIAKSVPFVKGLKYEDFPWWSEVILGVRKATITNLMLYYYFPAATSIVRSTAPGECALCFMEGMDISFEAFRKKATPVQYQMWSKYCKWPVFRRQVTRNLLKTSDSGILLRAKTLFSRLSAKGVFDDCTACRDRKMLKKLTHYLDSV